MIIRSTLISWFIIYVYPLIYIYLGDMSFLYLLSDVGFVLSRIVEVEKINNTDKI